MGRGGGLRQQRPPLGTRRHRPPQGDPRVPDGVARPQPHGQRPHRRHVAPHGGVPPPQGLGRFRASRFDRLSLRRRDAALAFPGDCSNTTEELSLVSTSDASGGSRSSRPDMVTVVMDGTFLDDLDLICPRSLPVLHEIALLVIRAGYRGELLRMFTKAPCDVLDRFLSVLQVERCCLEADRISFEEAEWWATEDMAKQWIVASKLVGKALALMQRQLQAQSCGAFERFKNDCFLAIAKQSIFALLRFADGFTSIQSPEKLIYVRKYTRL